MVFRYSTKGCGGAPPAVILSQMAGMAKLRTAMGRRTAWSVSKDCDYVGHQQIQNLLTGITMPWRVSVETAQQISEALDGIYVEDFLRPE